MKRVSVIEPHKIGQCAYVKMSNDRYVATTLTISLLLRVGLCLFNPSSAQMQSGDPGTGSGLTDVRFGSVVPVVRETGNISLSVDGVGTNSSSGIVQVEKPAGAT